MLNECNVDATIEKSVLSLKNLPGQTLETFEGWWVSYSVGMIPEKSLIPATKSKRANLRLAHAGVQLSILYITLWAELSWVFKHPFIL